MMWPELFPKNLVVPGGGGETAFQDLFSIGKQVKTVLELEEKHRRKSQRSKVL